MKPKLNSRQLYALKADMVRVLRLCKNTIGNPYSWRTVNRFTLAEIAAVLGTTKERVRQLDARGRKNFQR